MFKRNPTNSIGSKKRIGVPSKPAGRASVKLKTDKQLKLTKAMKNKLISEKETQLILVKSILCILLI